MFPIVSTTALRKYVFGFGLFRHVTLCIMPSRLPGAYRTPKGLTMRTKLTPSFVAKAVPEAGKDRTIYWDQAQPGFGLLVTEAGSKSWVVQYRANRRSRRATIDSVLTLDKARKKAKAMLGNVAAGGDPVAEERAAAAAEANTLQSVAEEYLRRESKNLRSHATRRATLERWVFPKLGARQIGDIKRSEISRLLDHVEDNAGPVQADMVLAFLRRVFSWHASRTDDFSSLSFGE
jgi:hypothetical protein